MHYVITSKDRSTPQLHPGDTITLIPVRKRDAKTFVACLEKNHFDSCDGCFYSRGRGCYNYPFSCG